MKLSILLHGLESERSEIDAIKDKLQLQLNALKRDDIDVIFYIDNGETTEEEKKAWLKSQCTSKKYVHLDSKSEVPDNFILLRYNAIKLGWSTEKQIKLKINHNE
jgi:hypothetical protein